MSTTDIHAASPSAPLAPSRASTAAYWAATLFVTLTALGAGTADILHAQPLYGLLLHLGYPPYFATLLGLWKVAGAVVLLAPRWPLVKEWAYAGMLIDYVCAVVSHAAAGDGGSTVVGPLVALAALAASWHLRPESRRLARAGVKMT
jgi:hypothetical protein